MSGTAFSIIAAVKNAYLFVAQEWKYLLRLSLLPAGISVGTQLWLFVRSKEGLTVFEAFIWGLPASAVIAWFMFHETRLLLLNEKASSLPDNAEFLADRKQAMKASVIIWVLFSMAWSAVQGYQAWAFPPTVMPGSEDFWLAGIAALLFGAFFWGLRFGVAHILAAVQYPIKQYVQQVNGLGISLKLAGMCLLALIPVGLVFALSAQIFFQNMWQETPEGYKIVVTPEFLIVDSLMTIVIVAILNAAGGFALKELLQKSGRSA